MGTGEPWKDNLFNKPFLGYFQWEWVILVIAALLFIPFSGNVHLFDWDEINFAECAREMLVTGDFSRVYINFLPFWEKPPLFFWLQAMAMEVFGVGEFAARLPNGICGMITLFSVFRLGKKLYNSTFGLIWAGVFAGSVLPHLYFHSGIIDPWFNLFIFLGIHFFILYGWEKQGYTITGFDRNRVLYMFLSGTFIGLALITKGPAGLLIFLAVIGLRLIFSRFPYLIKVREAGIFLSGLVLFSSLWYGYEYLKNGSWFLKEFILYNFRLFSTPDAGHGGFPGYHFVVLFFGCFPGSLFFIHGHYKSGKDRHHQSDYKIYMLILFWVVLILFSVVRSKIVHYSSLCYFPLTYVASLSVYSIFHGDWKMPSWIPACIFFILLILGAAVFSFPWLTENTELLKPLFSADPFALANLEARVRWDGWEKYVGLWLWVLCAICVFAFAKKYFALGFQVLFGGMALSVVLILWALIGRIEAFSQGAAIDFFKSIQKEKAYVLTHNYRSYAQYFYGRVGPENKPALFSGRDLSEKLNNWKDSLLLSSRIRKDVYLVSKINQTQGLERYPELKKIGSKNGWVFFVRRINAPKTLEKIEISN
jgi:4-amino-4-deoxy-L-arabinose transferase-like glycosyltransferase